jgi:hypothetical protein
MQQIEIQILLLTCFINGFLVCREDKFQCHTRTMGIEHVFVVYDSTKTNRFDLGGRKLVRGIELTHYDSIPEYTVVEDARVANNAAVAQVTRIEEDAASDAARAAAHARQAIESEIQQEWHSDLNNGDVNADAEDHSVRNNVDLDGDNGETDGERDARVQQNALDTAATRDAAAAAAAEEAARATEAAARARDDARRAAGLDVGDVSDDEDASAPAPAPAGDAPAPAPAPAGDAPAPAPAPAEDAPAPAPAEDAPPEGGSGGEDNSENEPEIYSFDANPNPVPRGHPTTVTAHFDAGEGGRATADGVADEVVSLVGYQITRFHPGNFSYTLVVTNREGASADKNFTLVVT